MGLSQKATVAKSREELVFEMCDKLAALLQQDRARIHRYLLDTDRADIGSPHSLLDSSFGPGHRFIRFNQASGLGNLTVALTSFVDPAEASPQVAYQTVGIIPVVTGQPPQ